MKLKKLRLKHFRNLNFLEFEPSPGVNFVIGKNGQGKTSVLEAISVLAGLKSFRSSKAQEWIQFDNSFSDIEGEVVLSDVEVSLRVSLERLASGTVRRSARVNEKLVRSSTDYLTYSIGSQPLGLHAVSFNPSDHDLVRDEPAVRRQYLDRVLSSLSPDYLRLIQKYRKVLEQRNAALEELRISRGSREVLESLNETLIECGVPIALERVRWLRVISPFVEAYSQDIAPTQKTVSLSYVSKWLGDVSSPLQGGEPSLEIMKQSFQKSLESNLLAEIRMGSTLVGPHRDDWAFEMGEAPLKGFGSQGEVRTVLLALKLSEIRHYREQTGRLPLLLLDDFSSELDAERRKYLLRFLEGTDLQVMVTTTDSETSVGKRFEMMDGKLI